MHTYTHTHTQVPLFANLDRGFLSTLSNRLKSVVYIPGEFVVFAGDLGREMV